MTPGQCRACTASRTSTWPTSSSSAGCPGPGGSAGFPWRCCRDHRSRLLQARLPGLPVLRPDHRHALSGEAMTTRDTPEAPEGPYCNDDGDWWVPVEGIPFQKARTLGVEGLDDVP